VKNGKIRLAILGGSESGKTFLASGFVRGQWRFFRRRSIVFDPWKGETDWGPGAIVFSDFQQFRRAVFGVKNCCVVWDEGTSTGGRDRENVDLFTAIRHFHPAFIFIGHRFDAMLPVMRGSLTDVMLAKQHTNDLREWAALLADDAILTAAALDQYAFLHKRAFQPVAKLQHTADTIKAGLRLD
jgi:hypothetical protein